QQRRPALAGAGKPGGDRSEIADVADAPARAGRTREEGDEQTRAAAAGRISHRSAGRASAWPRQTPPRAPVGSRRDMTRAGSRKNTRDVSAAPHPRPD